MTFFVFMLKSPHGKYADIFLRWRETPGRAEALRRRASNPEQLPTACRAEVLQGRMDAALSGVPLSRSIPRHGARLRGIAWFCASNQNPPKIEPNHYEPFLQLMMLRDLTRINANLHLAPPFLMKKLGNYQRRDKNQTVSRKFLDNTKKESVPI